MRNTDQDIVAVKEERTPPRKVKEESSTQEVYARQCSTALKDLQLLDVSTRILADRVWFDNKVRVVALGRFKDAADLYPCGYEILRVTKNTEYHLQIENDATCTVRTRNKFIYSGNVFTGVDKAYQKRGLLAPGQLNKYLGLEDYRVERWHREMRGHDIGVISSSTPGCLMQEQEVAPPQKVKHPQIAIHENEDMGLGEGFLDALQTFAPAVETHDNDPFASPLKHPSNLDSLSPPVHTPSPLPFPLTPLQRSPVTAALGDITHFYYDHASRISSFLTSANANADALLDEQTRHRDQQQGMIALLSPKAVRETIAGHAHKDRLVARRDYDQRTRLMIREIRDLQRKMDDCGRDAERWLERGSKLVQLSIGFCFDHENS
ncbi:hypothetical protein HKX48_006805 [Thoreauomyces humboldtii]|nr:hypothetical protein HKX48_006805 [Thoreauomyces humboldtii]